MKYCIKGFYSVLGEIVHVSLVSDGYDVMRFLFDAGVKSLDGDCLLVFTVAENFGSLSAKHKELGRYERKSERN